MTPVGPRLDRAAPTRRVDDQRTRSVPRRVEPRLLAGARALHAVESLLPVLVLVGVMVAANFSTMPQGIHSFLELRITVKNVLLAIGFGAGCALVQLACGLYDAHAVARRGAEYGRVIVALSICTALALIFPLTSISGDVRMVHLLGMWPVLVALGLLGRSVRRWAARPQLRRKRRLMVVGTGPESVAAWQHFAGDEAAAYDVVGYVDLIAAPTVAAYRRLGSIGDLEQRLMRLAIDEVFVALSLETHFREFRHVITVCERVGTLTRYQADIFPTTVARPQLDHGALSGAITMHVAPNDWRLTLKRGIDVAAAFAALMLFAPVLVLVALAIKLTSPGPVLYAQERWGLNRRPFRMFKFRTMVVDADAQQASLESKNEASGPVFKMLRDPRITPVGRLLRRTSLDELPQLVNIIKGDMSLVGPRPLPLRDVRRFRRATDMRRFSVSPGLTCLWQISGRSTLGFGEWVQLDLQYIDRWSLAEDFRILALTIPAVVRGTGAM